MNVCAIIEGIVYATSRNAKTLLKGLLWTNFGCALQFSPKVFPTQVVSVCATPEMDIWMEGWIGGWIDECQMPGYLMSFANSHVGKAESFIHLEIMRGGEIFAKHRMKPPPTGWFKMVTSHLSLQNPLLHRASDWTCSDLWTFIKMQ